MPERAIFVWLSVLTLVTSNPVPQVFPNPQYANQQTIFIPPTSIPASCPVAASQNNPCDQHVTQHHQASVRGNSDGSIINELLINNILGNSCLQKILDPNTKLYNQNGHEIKRQRNTGATPSVVNNYFIVPPEFFNINSNKTDEKSKDVSKRRKIDIKKTKSNKNNLNDSEDKKNSKLVNGVEKNKKRKKSGRSKTKNGIKAETDKIATENEEKNDEMCIKGLKSEVRVTKKRKKESSRQDPLIKTKVPNDGSKNNINEQTVDKISVLNNEGKKPKKIKKKSQVIETETTDDIHTVSEKLKIQEYTHEPANILRASSEVGNESHLKNIESPLDYSETLNMHENIRPIKHVKENRKTRNPNTDKAKKELKGTNKPNPRNTAVSEDMLRNFHPFTYTGNNQFFPNGNYPFNFEQFYQPLLGNNNHNKKIKNNKERKTSVEQNKQESRNKVIELKLKPKKHENTTTSRNFTEKNKEKVISDAIKPTTTANFFDEENTEEVNLQSVNMIQVKEAPERTTKIEIKNLTYENIPEQFKEDKPEMNPQLHEQKQESPAIKTNLEMPPTFIENLHENITPELGSEDIVPTFYTNGIIDDYFPIFYDSSQYSDDESYYLRDLEDNRHFYTTDRGFQEPPTRDRRKYNIYEGRRNNNIKDRINFRRNYKLQDGDKSRLISDDKGYIRRLNTDKINQEKDIFSSFSANKETEEVKPNNNKENQFQTPPLLEKPDFITKKIEKFIPESEKANNEIQEPVYIELVESVPLQKCFDPKPIQYSRLQKFDDDINKNDQSTTKVNTRNDRIETMFAKTRVVKYGIAKEEQENSSSPPLFENDGEELHSDGHTTYVLAKSLSSDDYFW